MKLLIVEDEELAAEKLQDMVLAIESQAEIVGRITSVKKTVEWLNNNPQPDILLLDIELSDGQSFEIFNQVDIKSSIIFTTSYDEFAIKAFKVNSIDYLLKPVIKEDLKKAFAKYKKLQIQHKGNEMQSVINIQQLLGELRSQMQVNEYKKRFLVKQGQKHLPIEVEDIAYFYIDDRVIFFKTLDNKKYIVDYTMDELDQMLDPTSFFRINRSFIIGIKGVRQIHDYVNSRLLLTIHPSSDMQAIVSRNKVNDFKKWIGK